MNSPLTLTAALHKFYSFKQQKKKKKSVKIIIM